MLNPHKHEQYVWTDPGSYDHDMTKWQKHRRHYQTAPYKYHNSEQIPLYHSGNGSQPPGYTNSSISGDSEVSSIYTCFVGGTEGHLSRFYSQMQSIADCSNMLDAQCLPPPGNNYSHEQMCRQWPIRLKRGTDLALNHLLNIIE